MQIRISGPVVDAEDTAVEAELRLEPQELDEEDKSILLSIVMYDKEVLLRSLVEEEGEVMLTFRVWLARELRIAAEAVEEVTEGS